MPRKQRGTEAGARQVRAPPDIAFYYEKMPVVASQSLGAEPSPSAVPPLTVSPPHDLPRNPLPNVNLFQHGGLGFHSNDIGPEHANSLPPSLPSTDSPVQQPHGSPDDVHTTSSELQSFIKNPGASDNGEQFKLGPAGDAVDGLSKRRRTAKSNPSAVPLFCSACPHRPHFSDLSHLLTHLGSRGHTKYEFDARVRADTKTDPAAIKVIEEYDVWFKENNISQMLAARMNDKEKKKQEREEGEVAKRKKSSNRTTSSRKRKANDNEVKRNEVKRETGDDAVLRQTPVGEQFAFHGRSFDFDGSPTNSGSLDSGSSSLSLQPTSYFAGDGACEDSRSADVSFLSDNEFERANERLKLKGVYWPGMNIFDSATPENKRKRNQRKDSSVITRMMRDSSAIQPTLMVCDRNLTIERTRDIYDSATEEEVMPKPPKTKRARTTASKPAIKKEESGATPTAAQPQTMQNPSDERVQATAEKRARRGSAALARTRIAEQAQIDFDANSEDNLEEGDDLDRELASRPAIGARLGLLGQPSTMAQQWPLDLSRTNSSQSYRDGNSTTAGSDIFRDDEGNTGVSQGSAGSQTESRFRRRPRLPLQPLSCNLNAIANTNFSSPTPSSKRNPLRVFGGKESNHKISQGITSQHQQNSQAMTAFGMTQNDTRPRSAWSGNMDSSNFLALPLFSPYGDDMFSDGQAPSGHAAQGSFFPGQMDFGYADGFQPPYFQSTSSRQNQPWHSMNSSSGTYPNADQNAFFSASWMSNDQAFSFDQSDQHSFYDGDIGHLGSM